jgi:hypothetical protein
MSAPKFQTIIGQTLKNSTSQLRIPLHGKIWHENVIFYSFLEKVSTINRNAAKNSEGTSQNFPLKKKKSCRGRKNNAIAFRNAPQKPENI